MANVPSDRFVSRFAIAMATMEGFYKPGSMAQRNNNPGNIRPWKNCPFPVVDNMIVFPTASRGWAQLHAQIRKNIQRGLTCYEFFGGKPGVYAGYAPAADKNDPKRYAEYVAARLLIEPGEVLRDSAAAYDKGIA